MSSSFLPIALKDKRKSEPSEIIRTGADHGTAFVRSARRPPFFRIPPFPGANVQYFRELDARDGQMVHIVDIVDMVRQLRVGGTYWGAQPALPANCVLVRTGAGFGWSDLFPTSNIVLWDAENACSEHRIGGECDPWHMLSGASAVVVDDDDDDDLRIVAAVLGVDCYVVDRVSGGLQLCRDDAAGLLACAGTAFANPFTSEAMTQLELVELCGFWRRLIDSNRDISGATGFAFWKQSHVAPLLWGGSSEFKFGRSARDVDTSGAIAVWRSKARPETIRELELRNVSLVEVEDGFLRSRGLGADCVPPLSITVDRLRPHFDPSGPTELETLIENGGFDEALLGRARELRESIVAAGLGKYERGSSVVERRTEGRRHIVVPGQVEDDRAVQLGGCGIVSNLELLRRVRQDAPDAHIIYKPHPDVLAGHRRGAIPDRLCLQYADEVVSDLPIASLIMIADEIHVNTSLAGFEALLRDKPVTTHGVPFYAGWGLTRDLGPVPARRTARRTVDELVASTLLLYPRYLDPVTGLPCPAEVIVDRLTADDVFQEGMIVGIRRFQGRLMRRLWSLVQ